MTLEKITDSTYAVVDGSSRGNMGFIILGNKALVVDTGMNHLVTNKVLDEFLKIGAKPDMILYTHYHSDHTFGAQCFGDIPIISSVQTNQVMADMLTKHWTRDSILNGYGKVKDDRPKLWEAVQTLEIKMPVSRFDGSFELGDNEEVSIIHLGGHTTGSSIAFLKAERVVFIGDLIFNKSFPYAGDPTCDPDDWIAALESVIQLKPEIVIPGHGPVGGLDIIEEQLEFLTEFKDTILEAIQNGRTPEDYIQEKEYPDLYTKNAEHRIESSTHHWFQYYS